MMIESAFTDDTWVEVETEHTVARWESEDRPIAIEVSEFEDSLDVSIYRRVSADGYTAMIETFSDRVRSIDAAESRVLDVVEDLDDSEDRVVAIGADAADVGDETFIHFYCVFESMLPDSVSVDDIAFEDDTPHPEDGVEVQQGWDVDDPEGATGIRIDVYPVHESEVSIDE